MEVSNLKNSCSTFIKLLEKENLFYQKARNGNIETPSVLLYLVNGSFIVGHTIAHLKIASVEAWVRDSHALSKYFLSKIKEEEGHDFWAHNDIKVLCEKHNINLVKRINPETHDLIHFLENNIRNNPELYLCYIYMVELWTITAGGELVKLLKESNGIAKDCLSLISNHIELDLEHVAENDLEYEPLVKNLKDSEFQDFTSKLYKKYWDLYSSFAKTKNTSDEVTRRYQNGSFTDS